MPTLSVLKEGVNSNNGNESSDTTDIHLQSSAHALNTQQQHLSLIATDNLSTVVPVLNANVHANSANQLLLTADRGSTDVRMPDQSKAIQSKGANQIEITETSSVSYKCIDVEREREIVEDV